MTEEYTPGSFDLSALDQALDEKRVQQIQAAHEVAMKTLGRPLMNPGIEKISVKKVLNAGAALRDGAVWKYPLLPGAIGVFQQLAAGREWMVSGKPRSVSRAIEWINLAEVTDLTTGNVSYGYENFLKRRVLDYLLVGRTAFAVEKRGNKPPILEYLDPTRLDFSRKNNNDKVTPKEVVWKYASWRDFKAQDVFIDHPIPMGTNLFIAPVAPIMPTAMLAWLVREHLSASLDGRKIRDIIFVSNPSLRNALQQAINSVAGLWAGESVDKVGLPIVELNNPTGQEVGKLFALLGLSRMPDNFDLEEFNFGYANEIAGNLSLALRHFYNNERTTNKALEEVQERRGQQKGPSMFVRSEQRLMSMPGVLEWLGGGSAGKKLRFGFLEETDASARLDNAQILFQTAQALEKVATVFGATVSMEAYLAWMQSLGVLPNELALIQSTNPDVVVNPDDTATGGNGDVTGESDPTPNAIPEDKSKDTAKPAAKKVYDARHPAVKIMQNPAYFIDYDEVTMNSKGEVIDRRVKLFTVAKLVAVQKLIEIQEAEEREPQTAIEALQKGIEAFNSTNQILFRKFHDQIKSEIKQWSSTQLIFRKGVVSEAIQACLNESKLTDQQQNVIDEIVSKFIDEPVGEFPS